MCVVWVGGNWCNRRLQPPCFRLACNSIRQTKNIIKSYNQRILLNTPNHQTSIDVISVRFMGITLIGGIESCERRMKRGINQQIDQLRPICKVKYDDNLTNNRWLSSCPSYIELKFTWSTYSHLTLTFAFKIHFASSLTNKVILLFVQQLFSLLTYLYLHGWNETLFFTVNIYILFWTRGEVLPFLLPWFLGMWQK